VEVAAVALGYRLAAVADAEGEASFHVASMIYHTRGSAINSQSPFWELWGGGIAGTSGIGTIPVGAVLLLTPAGKVRAISVPNPTGDGPIMLLSNVDGGASGVKALGNSGGGRGTGMGGGVLGASTGSLPARSKPGTPDINVLTMPEDFMFSSLGGAYTSCPS
jgi:hypothetical protein